MSDLALMNDFSTSLVCEQTIGIHLFQSFRGTKTTPSLFLVVNVPTIFVLYHYYVVIIVAVIVVAAAVVVTLAVALAVVAVAAAAAAAAVVAAVVVHIFPNNLQTTARTQVVLIQLCTFLSKRIALVSSRHYESETERAKPTCVLHKSRKQHHPQQQMH